MAAVEAPARAKINLFLHVGPRQADGFHELDSYVAFVEAGDSIRVELANELSLEITGPFAGALSGEPLATNLVWRAAEALRARAGGRAGALIRLEKRLPVASGVGGGSADAAAALHALNILWDLGVSSADLEALGFALGADLPMCVRGAPARARGAGEKLSFAPPPPETAVVLANPGVPTPTGRVFALFDEAPPPPAAAPGLPPAFSGVGDFAEFLAGARNDLEVPARRLVPVIDEVLALLRGATGCLLARMSGSGATCFGLFDGVEAARTACNEVARARPDWWAIVTALDTRETRPQESRLA